MFEEINRPPAPEGEEPKEEEKEVSPRGRGVTVPHVINGSVRTIHNTITNMTPPLAGGFLILLVCECHRHSNDAHIHQTNIAPCQRFERFTGDDDEDKEDKDKDKDEDKAKDDDRRRGRDDDRQKDRSDRDDRRSPRRSDRDDRRDDRRSDRRHRD